MACRMLLIWLLTLCITVSTTPLHNPHSPIKERRILRRGFESEGNTPMRVLGAMSSQGTFAQTPGTLVPQVTPQTPLASVSAPNVSPFAKISAAYISPAMKVSSTHATPAGQFTPSPKVSSAYVPPTPTTTPFSKVTAAPPSSLVLSNTPLTLPTDKLASTCTGSHIPLQTSYWFNTKQVSLTGGKWFEGKSTNWTFSTDTPGVILGLPSVPSAQDSGSGTAQIPFQLLNRTRPDSMEITIGALGSNNLIFQVYQDDGSSTSIPEDAWKLQPGQQMSGRTDLRNLGYDNVVFQLNVTGYGACNFPVDQTSNCSAGNLQLNGYNWMAYRVDDFLSTWLKSKGGKYTNGMMEDFKNDHGIHTDVCSVQKPCESLQKCDLQSNPNSQDAVAIYLAYEAMVNLSNFFNMLYSNVLNSGTFETNNIASMVQNFYPGPQAVLQKASGPGPLQLASMILGMASFGLFGIPGIGFAAGSVAGVTSSALGMAAAFQPKGDIMNPADVDFINSADLSNELNSVLGSLQYTVEQWHIATLSQGTNFTTIAHGGAFADPSIVEFNTKNTSAAAAWLQQYITVKMINHAWWSENVYISYMPYGKVKKQDGSGQYQDFDESQCAANFLGKTGTVVLCNTDDLVKSAPSTFKHGAGMARLTWYDSNPDKLSAGICLPAGHEGQMTHTSLNLQAAPPGWAQNPSYATGDGNYTFSTNDVLMSSVASWIKGGYNYNYAEQQTNQLNGSPDDAQALEAMAGLQSSKPSDAGMFNLPVVVIQDLSLWPDFSNQAGFKNYFDTQTDQNGKKITDQGTLPPQLQTLFTEDDLAFPVIKNDACK